MRQMLRLSLRNLGANRLRFALTTFAVLLGVSFVVASFVLTDGLLRTFDTLVAEANEGVDARVRSESDFDEVEFLLRPVDESVLDEVRQVDGVAEAEGVFQSFKIIPVDGTGPDAEPLETQGPPVLSFNWGESTLNPMNLVAGEAPDEPGEFVMDVGAVERENFVIGERYDMIGVEGREPFTLVGATQFGDENSIAGTTILGFLIDEIWRLDGADAVYHQIEIAAERDVAQQELVDNVAAGLPDGVEAITGDEATADDQEDFTTIINIFGNILLAFALVAVFVSTFIISNTFNILLGRRVRQLALLRALGASSGQVRFATLLEALIIGLLASVLGLGCGLALALGLRELMNALGFELPDFDLILSARTIIAAVVVGVGVTLLASYSPARRAARVPPVAAMRAGFRFGSGEGTRRTIIATVLAVPGVLLLAYGVFGSGSTAAVLAALGVGAVLVFIAVSMYAPLFSSPAASALGAPLEKYPGDEITGHMARSNAARDNKRTARTAAGLMIGLALIAMATVVAQSLKETVRAQLGSTVVADYLITSDNNLGFSNQLSSQVEALPEFEEVAAVRDGSFRVAGDTKEITGTELSFLTDLLDLNVIAGDLDATDSLVLTEDAATDNAVGVGDTLEVEFAETGMQAITVGAIIDDDFLSNHIVDLELWEQNFASQDDNTVAAKLAEGVDTEEADAALAPLEGAFPQLNFETRDEFTDRLESQLDSLLVIINVFLGLAIVIALLGIANTMALSVLERTQEIGLMRAIGMTRRQTRRLIRLEAGIVSLFGALLGVIVGLIFGWLAVVAIPDSAIDRLAVPAPTLVFYVVIATVAGLLVASLPARRASRLDILDAIGDL
ncbi:MAG: FtsX-like permease family protein [Acidimicrobiia bacterium]|nr:FtsX-like permease family protein [Acidimicrobiia bacterium]